MTVDIDIGGSGLDEYDDEEEVPVEDMEEVEAVEVIEDEQEPIPPQKTPPQATKKRSVWVKRIMIGVVVILLILVALWSYLYFGTKVTNITVDLTEFEDDDEKIYAVDVTALVGTTGLASVAGKGDLEITFNNDVIYTSKISIDDGGTGKLRLPYNNFVERNGFYSFQVKYRDLSSPPKEYEVGYIVENMNITAEVGMVNDDGQMDITVFMQDINRKHMGATPEGARLKIDEIKRLDDNSDIARNEGPSDVEDSFEEFEFLYTLSGNYTISVTIENTRAKSDSEYHEITETRDIIYLNALPVAKAIVEVQPNPTVTTFTVKFDASSSWNDGAKTLYKWDFNEDGDFDDPDEQTKEAIVYHDFARVGNYDVTLNVEGDVYIWDPWDNEYFAERGAIVLQVNSP